MKALSVARRELLDPTFLARLERLELNVRRVLSGESRGESTAPRRGSGTLFREHRQYVTGDDPRFLDWNAYLRLGDLLVKEFVSEEAPRLLLLIDRSGSMGLQGEAKLLAALRLAAALGAVALCRHTAVACTPFPGPKGELFRGRASLARLLEMLSGVEPGGEAHFLAAFQAACPPGRPAGVAVVLSDFFEVAEHAPALRFLRRRGFLVHALHLVDRRDLDVQPGDRIELLDVESGRMHRERIDDSLARAYAEAVELHFREVAEVCRGLRVLYERIDVAEPIESVVLGLLRRGALR